jgi:pilus assembly protein CpaB
MFRRKLSRTSFVLLTISLACAVGAAVVMRAYAVRLDATRPDGGPPSRVVTAADDVTRGTILSDELLEIVTLPTRFLPPGAIRDPGRVTGRVAAADLAAGEVLTALRVAGGRAGPTASVVPPGMRAVQVPVASTVGVRPGDVVDVLATFGGGGAHTEVAGEALEVLSIDRQASGALGAATGPNGGIGLVLLVAPTDAQRLAFAATFATLSIAVRSPGDLVSGQASFAVPAGLGR